MQTTDRPTLRRHPRLLACLNRVFCYPPGSTDQRDVARHLVNAPPDYRARMLAACRHKWAFILAERRAR